MLVAKPCGHVTCKTCTDSLVRPDKQCILCNSALGEKDIIELRREGPCFHDLIPQLPAYGVFRYWICGWRAGGNVEDGHCISRIETLARSLPRYFPKLPVYIILIRWQINYLPSLCKVAILSFSKIGIPCNGPRGPVVWRSRSRAAACSNALGFVSITARRVGPWRLTSSIRAK